VGLKTLLDIPLEGSEGLEGLKTHIQMHWMTTQILIGPQRSVQTCLDLFGSSWTHSGPGLKTNWVQSDLAGLNGHLLAKMWV